MKTINRINAIVVLNVNWRNSLHRNSTWHSNPQHYDRIISQKSFGDRCLSVLFRLLSVQNVEITNVSPHPIPSSMQMIIQILKQLAKYLTEVAANRNEYEKYHRWRIDYQTYHRGEDVEPFRFCEFMLSVEQQ